MTITPFTGGEVQTNGFLIESGGEAVVIDAPRGIAAFLRGRKLLPTALLLTHQHFDHVEDVAALAEMGAEIFAHSPFSRDLVLDQLAQRWGVRVEVARFDVSNLLEDRDSMQAGPHVFGVHHVPGHSPDSLCFHLETEATVFAGDTVFAGSVGRTDLPGGNHDLLLEGIRRELLTLPPSTRVLPGHGPATTIGHETASNPFLT